MEEFSRRDSLLPRGLHEVSSEGKVSAQGVMGRANKGSLCDLMQSIWRCIESFVAKFDQPSRVLKHVFNFHFQAYLSILGIANEYQ